MVFDQSKNLIDLLYSDVLVDPPELVMAKIRFTKTRRAFSSFLTTYVTSNAASNVTKVACWYFLEPNEATIGDLEPTDSAFFTPADAASENRRTSSKSRLITPVGE